MKEREGAIWVYENANIINAKAIRDALKPLLDKIVDLPDVNVVSYGAYTQTAWERDIAIKQLESYGVGLGADKELVEVRHGHWEWTGSSQICSCCGEEQPGFDTSRYYCPNCGARMDLKEN